MKQVQAAALPGVWSLGVRLARGGSARLLEKSAGEPVYRVKTPGKPVAPSCTLYLEEGEWACDCDSNNDPCEHVVAAAIAAQGASRADPDGTRLAEETSQEPSLGYRLERAGGPSLVVSRVIVHPGGKEEQLTSPLSSLIARRRCPIEPTHDDLAVDGLLTRAQGFSKDRTQSLGLTPEGFARLLEVLSTARDVRLGGAEIRVDPKPLLPIATLEDQEEDLLLRIVAPSGIELVDRGVALFEGSLRPLGALPLAGSRYEKLPLERRVKRSEAGTLVTEILPEIERHISVDIRTNRLPARDAKLTPRIHFQITSEGHTLSVLPTLVYGDPPQARIDGEQLIHLRGSVPRRDPSAEQTLVQDLRDTLHLAPGRAVHYDGQEAARFATRLQGFEQRYQAAPTTGLVAKVPLVPRVEVRADGFDVTFQTSEDSPRRADSGAVLRAFQDGLAAVPLVDGGWAPLPIDWLQRFGSQISSLLLARRPDGSLPRPAVGQLADLCDALGLPPPPDLARLRPLFGDFESIPEATLPVGLRAELRSYQKRGIDWLSFLKDAELGAVLADDMGLGKTLQALSVMHGKTLVVCPRSLLFNWAAEIERFRPDLTRSVYHGPRRQLSEVDVTITTYALLRVDQSLLEAAGFEMVVLDEAQNIKSADSQVARAAFSLSDNLPTKAFRLALSGTPVENRLEELWSILRFTHPGLLGSQADFEQHFAAPIARGDAEAGARLRRAVKPFLLRRTKREVARDLPPRQDVILSVELSEAERSIYDAVQAAKQKEVVEKLEAGGSVIAALEALLRLRQAACHPALVPGQQTTESSSKVEALLEALEKALLDQHKCIVFSQWTSLLDLVEPELEARSMSFVRLDGSTRDRALVVQSFQDPEGPPLLLSSLKAGGTGLNLTAADHVFLLDPWWNPAAEDQAADRAHRIGQTRPVTVYRVIAKDTIEEGILGLQAKKRALSELLLGDGGAASGLSRDDLLELLRVS